MAQVAHQLEVVLDDQEGDAEFLAEAANVVADSHQQRRVDARRRLVEQDHLRMRHQRAPQLEQLALPAGERAGLRVGHSLQRDQLQHLVRPLLQRLLLAPHPPRRQPVAPDLLAVLIRLSQHHVLQHRHRLQLLRNLERAHQAAAEDAVRRHAGDLLAGKPHPPAAGPQKARQTVETGRLARAVGTDQPRDHAPLDREARAVHRAQAAEMAGQVLDFQQRRHRADRPLSPAARTARDRPAHAGAGARPSAPRRPRR